MPPYRSNWCYKIIFGHVNLSTSDFFSAQRLQDYMRTSLQSTQTAFHLYCKSHVFGQSALSISGITYCMTPLISQAYALSNIVSFVMISPGFYVLISFYYVVFLSSVILLILHFLFLGQLLVQCNYCLVVLSPLSLVIYYCLTLAK